MSTDTIEKVAEDLNIELFEGIDFEETPPCECVYVYYDFSNPRKCNKPSVARIKMTFTICGHTEIRFFCAECKTHLESNSGWTWWCPQMCKESHQITWEVV